METQFSLGAVHKNRQKNISTVAMHDELLRSALIDACEAAGLPDGVRNEIVEGGIHRFTIDDEGQVRPQSAFPDLKSYVVHCGTSVPTPRRSAISRADENAMRKAELYDLMIHYSTSSNMTAYRQTRNEWLKL